MRFRRIAIAWLAAAGIALPVAAHADNRFSAGIYIGPPPPPVVYVPAPQPGYAWAPGYWAWDGYRHVWVDGRLLRARPGYVWVPDRWERRGHYWHHRHGHWQQGRGHHGDRHRRR
jgi:hypothetical protein